MIQLLRNIYADYKKVERHIFFLVGAEFFLQLINSSFFLLLNYFLEEQGYADFEITRIIKLRFMMVMLLAAPLGFFIRGKRLKPFFMATAVSLPVISLFVIYTASHQMDFWLSASVMLWGASFTLIQVSSLPFILLNAKKEHHSEAISIFFQMWSASIFLCGMLNFGLNSLAPEIFTVKRVLQIFSIMGFASVFFISRISVREKRSDALEVRKVISIRDLTAAVGDVFRPYDWKLIGMVFIPTLLISIGAGFTIPVINLFFLNVHGVPAKDFSFYGATTYLMVAMGMTFIPAIRKRFGYQVAITLFQSLAVVALFFMATTEYYKNWEYAIYIAVFFYLIRQPLMNIAGPMTSELTMYYVGKRNQEMVSALNASIWSGSWFVSMAIFTYLRKTLEWKYVTIFLITVVLYVIGVAWYAWLIRSYESRKKRIPDDSLEENHPG